MKKTSIFNHFCNGRLVLVEFLLRQAASSSLNMKGAFTTKVPRGVEGVKKVACRTTLTVY